MAGKQLPGHLTLPDQRHQRVGNKATVRPMPRSLSHAVCTVPS